MNYYHYFYSTYFRKSKETGVLRPKFPDYNLGQKVVICFLDPPSPTYSMLKYL